MEDRKFSFSGTHKEIGEQVGEFYKKWGLSFSFVSPAEHLYEKQLKTYQKYYPDYLEFLEGVAKGSGKDKDKVVRLSLTIFLSLAKELASNQCSCFAINTKSGVLVGRNYDWLEASEKYSSMISYNFTDCSSFNLNGITDMGSHEPGATIKRSQTVILLDDAWNDKGLYVEINGAPGKKVGMGISVPQVVQLISEKCSDIEKAISILEEIPIPNSKIFTIADKSGHFAVVEKSLEKGTKVRRSNDLIIATNHFNHPDLISKNSEMFEELPFHSSFARYHYLETNLEKLKSSLTFGQVETFLDKPPVLQNWRGIDKGDVLTLWILSLNLTKDKYRVKFAPLTSSPVEIHN